MGRPETPDIDTNVPFTRSEWNISVGGDENKSLICLRAHRRTEVTREKNSLHVSKEISHKAESTVNYKIRLGRVSSELNKLLYPEISVPLLSLAASDLAAKNQNEIDDNRLARVASERNIFQSRAAHSEDTQKTVSFPCGVTGEVIPNA